jgi:16S rRNA (adenine1518-N6/adenine1519-N6)-dimethyltransferase
MSEDAPDRLLGPADVRRLAAELDLRPTKRRGQNFMVDANSIRRIVRTAALDPADVVLEVGPGLGSLTLGLLPAAAAVVAVEIDRPLAGRLPQTVADFAPELAPRLTVVTADAVRVTAAQLSTARGAPTALVANLPYNVAVPVLLHLLAELPSLQRGLVLVQAEVADRLVAPPGSRVYGAPSVKLAWWAAASRAGAVPRTVFWPVPNVDSALVRFARREPPAVAVDVADVFTVVDAAFAQRRKSLRGALAGWAGSADAAADLLGVVGVAPTARGEELDVTAFARLAAARAVRSST